MSVIYCYLRVSSKAQSQPDTVSLDMQRQICCEYYKKHYGENTNFLFFVEEVASARFMTNQVELLNLVNKRLSHGNTILVYNVSRLTRDASAGFNLLYKLADLEVNVISVTEDITSIGSRFMFRQRLCEANEESDKISDRVKKANNFIRQHGGHIGQAPYGYFAERVAIPESNYQIRVLKPEPTEMLILARIRQWTENEVIQNIADEQGVGVCNIVADKLNEQNIRKRNGNIWSAFAVAKYYKKFIGVELPYVEDDMCVDDDDIECKMCMDGTSIKGNEIVLCDGSGCKLAFHQKCIDLKKIPAGPFFCSLMCKFSHDCSA